MRAAHSHAPAYRLIERSLQALKLAIAESQEAEVETQGIVTRQEREAARLYCLEVQVRGMDLAVFRRRHRQAWRRVQTVMMRAPAAQEESDDGE